MRSEGNDRCRAKRRTAYPRLVRIRSMRYGLMIAGAALLVFGFFCLNYTKAGTVERHTAFAVEHGLPQPSPPIFYGGVLAVAFGGGAIGYGVGRSRSPVKSK